MVHQSSFKKYIYPSIDLLGSFLTFIFSKSADVGFLENWEQMPTEAPG